MKVIGEDLRKSTSGLDNGRKLFVAGLNEMNKDKQLYPDANSTMRLTYGKSRRLQSTRWSLITIISLL